MRALNKDRPSQKVAWQNNPRGAKGNTDAKDFRGSKSESSLKEETSTLLRAYSFTQLNPGGFNPSAFSAERGSDISKQDLSKGRILCPTLSLTE